jgi:hypothetical protein
MSEGHPFRSVIGPVVTDDDYLRGPCLPPPGEDIVTLAHVAEALDTANDLLRSINEKLDIIVGVDTPSGP